MQHWEYRVISLPTWEVDTQQEAMLVRMGADGWELAGTILGSTPADPQEPLAMQQTPVIFFSFKRQKES